MEKVWTDIAWEDYLYWQANDRKILKRLNQLLKDIDRNAYEGIGKPEPLRYGRQGFWSRRIDEEHRLIYRVEGGQVIISSCRNHYEE